MECTYNHPFPVPGNEKLPSLFYRKEEEDAGWYKWKPVYDIRLSEYRKIKALSFPNFSGKIRLLFVLFWLFFAKKGAWSHVKDWESKSHLAYTGATNPGVSNMQRVWSHHLPVLSHSVPKVVFFLLLKRFFRFSFFYTYHAAILEKNKFWCRI